MTEPEAPHRICVELPAPGPDGPVEAVALITLDRPEVLNALDSETMRQLVEALERLDPGDGRRRLVLPAAGGGAAPPPPPPPGATPSPRGDPPRGGRKPIVAAVRGYALGGGCELAMACDLVVSADDAVFGQPEIKLGVIPGAGGTQRLTRALGKAKAMELILTGRNLPAKEAEARGLVTKLVAREATLPAALELAAQVAAMPALAGMAAQEAGDRALRVSLEAGLEFARPHFLPRFGSEDQKEGMRAFVEKRAPGWKGR